MRRDKATLGDCRASPARTVDSLTGCLGSVSWKQRPRGFWVGGRGCWGLGCGSRCWEGAGPSAFGPSMRCTWTEASGGWWTRTFTTGGGACTGGAGHGGLRAALHHCGSAELLQGSCRAGFSLGPTTLAPAHFSLPGSVHRQVPSAEICPGPRGTRKAACWAGGPSPGPGGSAITWTA